MFSYLAGIMFVETKLRGPKSLSSTGVTGLTDWKMRVTVIYSESVKIFIVCILGEKNGKNSPVDFSGCVTPID